MRFYNKDPMPYDMNTIYKTPKQTTQVVIVERSKYNINIIHFIFYLYLL